MALCEKKKLKTCQEGPHLSGLMSGCCVYRFDCIHTDRQTDRQEGKYGWRAFCFWNLPAAN